MTLVAHERRSRAAIPARRVVVDALSARLGGGLSYLVNQLEALERVAPDLDLRILADRANAGELRDALDSPITSVPGGRLRPLLEQVIVPLRTHAGDVLYCPGNFAPIAAGRGAVVLTLQNPNYFGRGRRAPHNRSVDRRIRSALSRWSAAHADEVVVISRALADEVAVDLPEAASRAHLIPSGAPRWAEGSTRPPNLPIETDDFILSLANDAPHKHLDLTVDAWNEAFAGAGRLDHVPALVLAGRFFTPDRPRTQRERVHTRLRSRFVQLGGVTDRRQVRWLLEHARVMVSSASLEAHPLTPAEAGSLGCPLILSDIPAHREVAGAHATYVRAGSLAALVTAFAALGDPPSGGRDPAATWEWPVTWDDNARALAEVLRAVGGPTESDHLA